MRVDNRNNEYQLDGVNRHCSCCDNCFQEDKLLQLPFEVLRLLRVGDRYINTVNAGLPTQAEECCEPSVR